MNEQERSSPISPQVGASSPAVTSDSGSLPDRKGKGKKRYTDSDTVSKSGSEHAPSSKSRGKSSVVKPGKYKAREGSTSGSNESTTNQKKKSRKKDKVEKRKWIRRQRSDINRSSRTSVIPDGSRSHGSNDRRGSRDFSRKNYRFQKSDGGNGGSGGRGASHGPPKVWKKTGKVAKDGVVKSLIDQVQKQKGEIDALKEIAEADTESDEHQAVAPRKRRARLVVESETETDLESTEDSSTSSDESVTSTSSDEDSDSDEESDTDERATFLASLPAMKIRFHDVPESRGLDGLKAGFLGVAYGAVVLGTLSTIARKACWGAAAILSAIPSMGPIRGDYEPSQLNMLFRGWSWNQTAQRFPSFSSVLTTSAIAAAVAVPIVVAYDLRRAMTDHSASTWFPWPRKHTYVVDRQVFGQIDECDSEEEAKSPDLRADAISQVDLKHRDVMPILVRYSRTVLGVNTVSENMVVSAEMLAQITLAKNMRLTADPKTTAARLENFAASVQTVNMSRYQHARGVPVVQNTVRLAYAMHRQMLEESVAPFPRAVDHL